LALLALISGVAGYTDATAKICGILITVRNILYIIAGIVGSIVFVLQGIKWAASADDPGARKQAKEGVIHAIVGMIIVFLSVTIVTLILSTNYCAYQTLPVA
jgi:uncharacterized membrane-anchored protein